MYPSRFRQHNLNLSTLKRNLPGHYLISQLSGFSSRRIQSRAPHIYHISSQIQRSNQRSIQSFFLSTSDVISIRRSYIHPRIIQLGPPLVPEDSDSEPVPSSPPSPLAIRPGRPWHHWPHRQSTLSLSLDRLMSCPLFQSWTYLYILDYCTFGMVIYMYSVAVVLQVSFFMLFFLAFSRSCACTSTL